MNEVVIVSYARTPMGCFNGGLAPLSAIQLGSLAIQGAISKISKDSVSPFRVPIFSCLKCIMQLL